jgi:hypothetical protein
MTYDTAIGHYITGTAIAEALGIKSQAVYQWKRLGVVPVRSAMRLQAHSRGKVKVDPSVYRRQGRKPRDRAALPG